LIAEGTPSSNIIFTTLKDATYGGTGSAVKGSWARLIFSSTATNSSLKYLKYRYGGFYSGAPQPAVEVDSAAAVTFDTVTFEESQGSVFMLSGAGFTSMTIQNSTFQNNGNAPIKITSASPNILSNTVSSNTINGILITSDSNFTADTTWGSTIPYILESTPTARPTIASNAILTINPGVILKPQSSANEALRIDGVLNWIATLANPGIITSYKDDAVDAGGDTNGDGAATAPAASDWPAGAINFTNTTATSTLTNIKLRYGVNPNELFVGPGALMDQSGITHEP
ncbi:MAG: right-handed parallel beta-helix repeat-containing protein, partial [Patescibacteria group bacterium]